MSDLPEIASLWIGGDLSFLEQLCLKSFVDQGHKTTLYSYEPIGNLPPGVEAQDAEEIFPANPMRVHIKHQSPAIHADFFRVKLMLRGHGEIWADTDAYCAKPFAFDEPHVYGWLDGQIANGVMRLPKESAALRAYDAFLHESEPEPPWFSPALKAQLATMRVQGFTIPLEAMPWGTTGPQALTYFLQASGEIGMAQEQSVFYPMTWKTRRAFLKMPKKFLELTKPDTISYHFLGRIVRRILAQEFDGLPKPNSILDVLCRDHGIDPQAAPIIWSKG